METGYQLLQVAGSWAFELETPEEDQSRGAWYLRIRRKGEHPKVALYVFDERAQRYFGLWSARLEVDGVYRFRPDRDGRPTLSTWPCDLARAKPVRKRREPVPTRPRKGAKTLRYLRRLVCEEAEQRLRTA
jgi:hypothetical protein